MFECGLK